MVNIHLVEIAIAFVEGLALIISPCILPILPLVLASSVESGRRRPFGIIIGFVLAFTAFALLSRQLILLFHINLDYIKYGSLILLAAFGLILLSEKLSAYFTTYTQKFANLGSKLTANSQDGFGSGIFLGALIGLIWTPCAGPILAAVLVQVIRQTNDLQALLLIVSFSVGAALPMLLIALLGRSLMSKLHFFTRHAIAVRKTLGAIILAAVVLLASGVDYSSWENTNEKSINTQPLATGLVGGLTNSYRAPEFYGLTAWLNSKPLSMRDLKGKVVLVDFWTYSCINCIRTLPFITDWYQKYRQQGLVIVGIHAPEFEFEKNQSNVEAAVKRYRITYPVALDNQLETWSSFDNRYWPAHYLINKQGQVVYTHFGEGHYGITENNIRFLLGLQEKTLTEEKHSSHSNQTPETYLGKARTDRFNDDPISLAPHHWSVSGQWRNESERIVAVKPGATLYLHFIAGKVFLVMGVSKELSQGKPITVQLSIDGKPAGTLSVDSHKLYTLVDKPGMKEGILAITADQAGLEAYAFTFEN